MCMILSYPILSYAVSELYGNVYSPCKNNTSRIFSFLNSPLTLDIYIIFLSLSLRYGTRTINRYINTHMHTQITNLLLLLLQLFYKTKKYIIQVGYFNYRYFVNFLVYVFIGMTYGAIICYRPFMNSTSTFYRQQVAQYRKTGVWSHLHPYTPINSERMPLSLSFMLCLAVGLAVSCLGGFHIYLVLTGQTTIEFHANFVNKSKAKRSGQKYRNPYDMGWKRNWQQVYGYRSSMVLSFLIPSTREPDYLPVPISGEEGKRMHLRETNSNKNNRSIEDGNDNDNDDDNSMQLQQTKPLLNPVSIV